VKRAGGIPRFPTFKRLELADRSEIEEITGQFEPYSDFNFVSLWCWDTDEQCQVSRLNDNLVVKIKDYSTDDVHLTFLGTNAIKVTAALLLAYAERQGVPHGLRYVPEIAAIDDSLQESLDVSEDPGSFDYVLSVREWTEMRGGRFRNKRNAVNVLERRHAPEFRTLDLRSRRVQQDIIRVFLLWSDKRQRFGLGETRNELLALRRIFTIPEDSGLISFGVYSDEELLGFSINQLLPNNYAMGHFWKADHEFPGIYPFMLRESCRYLNRCDTHFFNIEQDLGKSGLANAKRLYRPCRLLRKFIISRPAVYNARPSSAAPNLADLPQTTLVAG
jgi:hypothetical protein